MGATVLQISATDAPDLLVGFRGKNYLFEVKNKYGKLRIGQKEFQENWCGQYSVVKTIEEILEVLTNN